MHMADALISPAVGGTMWAAAGGLVAYSARRLQEEGDDRKVPLMGVMGAFVFAAQMINFAIPLTGSSGHLGGGTLLAILLGPHAAFLVMASILTVQAFFFADGGLLALGCNIFNLGFFPCFVLYPLVVRPLLGNGPAQARLTAASMAASVLALQLGAFCVVLETLFSGISGLPFGTFVLLMQPIHLAIGIVEGLVTAAVVSFVWKARPEILAAASPARPTGKFELGKVAAGFLVAAVFTGSVLSWFASADPDGLEWSLLKTSGQEELAAPAGIHASLASVQEKTAFLPDYAFRQASPAGGAAGPAAGPAAPAWPAVSAGTSLSGLVGGGLTMVFAGLTGLVLRRRSGS